VKTVAHTTLRLLTSGVLAASFKGALEWINTRRHPGGGDITRIWPAVLKERTRYNGTRKQARPPIPAWNRKLSGLNNAGNVRRQ